jgi:hypothetical protein
VLLAALWIGSIWFELDVGPVMLQTFDVEGGRCGYFFPDLRDEGIRIDLRSDSWFDWWFWCNFRFMGFAGALPIFESVISIPLWVPLLAAATPASLLWRSDIKAHRRKPNVCWRCSYDRAGLAPDAKCPECGSAVPPK